MKIGEEFSSSLEKSFNKVQNHSETKKSFFIFFSLSPSDKENVDGSKSKPLRGVPFHGAFHLRPYPAGVVSERAFQVGGDGGGAHAEGRGAGAEEGGSEGGCRKRKSASGERTEGGGGRRRRRRLPPPPPQSLQVQKVFHAPSRHPTRSNDGLHGKRRSHRHSTQAKPSHRHRQLKL